MFLFRRVPAHRSSRQTIISDTACVTYTHTHMPFLSAHVRGGLPTSLSRTLSPPHARVRTMISYTLLSARRARSFWRPTRVGFPAYPLRSHSHARPTPLKCVFTLVRLLSSKYISCLPSLSFVLRLFAFLAAAVRRRPYGRFVCGFR